MVDRNSPSAVGSWPAGTGERVDVDDCQDGGLLLGVDGDKYLPARSSLGNDAPVSSATRRGTLAVVAEVVDDVGEHSMTSPEFKIEQSTL